MGRSSIEKLVGNKKWDVIHFNHGLHYFKFVIDADGNMPLQVRADGTFSGERQVSPGEYEKEMSRIVSTLKKTNALLIFATTTPVPDKAEGRLPKDPPIYNDIAIKVMNKNGVHVNDLYEFILPVLGYTQFSQNVHFGELGSWLLGAKVAESIIEFYSERPVRQ